MINLPWLLQKPENSAAVQAVNGIISTVAAIAAGIFAAGAYFATKRQAEEAHAQTLLAKASAEAERKYADEQSRIARAQMREQFRPIITVRIGVEGDDEDSQAFYFFTNEGTGPAKGLLVQPIVSGDLGPELGELTSLPYTVPAGKVTQAIENLDFGDFFDVFYESATGDRFCTRCNYYQGYVTNRGFVDDPEDWQKQ